MSSDLSLQRNKISPFNVKLYQSFGSLIKEYRQMHTMTQQTLAESIGISVRELQNWEADRHPARIDNLHDFSEFTGIPMQACVALNAGQPVRYSLRKRLFAYSSIEEAQFSSHDVFRWHDQLEDWPLTKYEPITTDREIDAILSCHHDVYSTERPLRRDVIKAAIAVVPDLNRILFDCWGHYVGHQLCLPMTKDVYQQLKKQKTLEDYLTAESISDILALGEGVFFFYSYLIHTFLHDTQDFLYP